MLSVIIMSVIMLCAIMPNVNMLNAIMPYVNMLSVIILNVIMVNIMAPLALPARLITDQHSSLFSRSVSDGGKRFITFVSHNGGFESTNVIDTSSFENRKFSRRFTFLAFSAKRRHFWAL
jgi:hypothetical protein